MAQKILIVEDEEKIARFVELELLHEGYEAEKVFDGRTGLDKALSGGFDLVVLDCFRDSTVWRCFEESARRVMCRSSC